MKKLPTILFILLGLMFSQCATILKGTNKTADISIDSNVQGAKIYVDEMYVGKTPAQTAVLQKNHHQIRLEKNGYEHSFYSLKSKVQFGYFLLDFFAFFPIGHAVDLVSGAWKAPSKRKLFIPMSLEKSGDSLEDPAQPKEEIITDINSDVRYSDSDIDYNIPVIKKTNQHAVAVVIGNKKYQHQDVPDVDFALNDAHTVKKYLIKTFGFKEGNIIYLENATQAQMNSIFGTKDNHKGLLHNYVRENVSDVFIYYSGHGAPDVDSKEGFFMPVDCNPNTIALNGYSLDTFYKNISQIKYNKLTVMIDACFSGQSDAGALIKNASPVIIKPRNVIFNDPDALVLTASASTQIASWYTEKEHSLFTYYTFKGIQGAADQDSNDKITINELRDYIENEVSYMARRMYGRIQTPEVIGRDEYTFAHLK